MNFRKKVTMEKLQQFREHQNKINAYRLALATMNYDLETIAPKDGADYRHKMMAFLNEQAFKLQTDKEYIQLAQELHDSTNDFNLKRETELILNNYNKRKNITPEQMSEFVALTYKSNDIWKEAKQNNDYQSFEPYLKQLIDKSRALIQTRDQLSQHIYDDYLDDFQEGLTQEKVEKFFDTIEARLVPFIKKVSQSNLLEPAFLTKPISVEKQKEMTKLVADYLGFTDNFSVIAETEHPFSSTLSINDTRITTHYHEDQFTSNIFSIIHEIGHSLYNHQVNPEYEGTELADSMDMTMHESQSRFLENNIGRSKDFWVPLYPKLQAICPEVLGSVTLDEFIYGINYPKISLIRIEADELTYSLHVLIRYRLEQRMITDNLSDNLNILWADEYERILGVRPQNDSEGILQDVHWSGGAFGYFPTYALGSAVAAMFYKKIQEDLDLSKELTSGNFVKVKDWLRENIHQYGALYTADEMILKVAGKEFDADDYCDYLISKFTRIYGIA